MLIIDNTKLSKLNFKELTIGDIFKSEDGDTFMRINTVCPCNSSSSTFNCVYLEDGELAYFDPYDKVTKVNAVVSLNSTEGL